MRVKFIYLIVPAYRAPLFDALIAQPDWDVLVQTTPFVPGHAKTSVQPSRHYDISHETKNYLGGRVRWMTGVMDISDLKKGDVLVLWGDPRFLNVVPLMRKARRQGVKTIWWGQGYTAYSAKRVGLRQKLMRHADAVMLYTDREIERYRAGGYDHPMLFAKNNALDQAPIQQARQNTSNSAIEEIRQKYNLTPGKTLVTVGRLIPKMQLDIAIRAIADPAMEGYQILVIGNGDEKANYEAVAAEVGVTDRIHYVGAIYNDAELAPFLLASDIFIYPGAIGLSIFHAFGFGLPVVTHDNEENQMPEWAALKPGVNGEVFPENSIEGFRSAIQRLNLPDNKAVLQQNCLDTVLNDWNMENTVRRFVECIETVAKS